MLRENSRNFFCKFPILHYFPMYQYKAKLLSWIDGDTLLVEIDLGFYVTRQERIRLARINAPEMNSPIPFQVKKAKHARAV